jgi:hypothetical protein
MATAFITLSFCMWFAEQRKGTIFILDSMMPVLGLRLTEYTCPSFWLNFWMMAFSVAMTISGFFWGAADGSALMVVMALQAMSSMVNIRFIIVLFFLFLGCLF